MSYSRFRSPAFRNWFGQSVVTVDGRVGSEPLIVYHGSRSAGFRSFTKKDRHHVGHFFTDDYEVAASYTSTTERALMPRFRSIKEANAYAEENMIDFEVEIEKDFEYDIDGNPIEDRKIYIVWANSARQGEFESAQEALAYINDELEISHPGIYEVCLRIEEPLIVDAQGADWDKIPYEVDGELEAVTTTWLSHEALEMGADGVIIHNVVDSGGYGGDHPATVYIIFSPTQVKSVENRGTWDPRDEIITNPSEPRKNPARARLRGMGVRSNPHFEDYMPKGFVDFHKKYSKLAKKKETGWLYVQFTTHQGDTLYKKAYEFPNHSDPAGIYAYPIEYVLKYPADIWYGAGAKYLRVLRAKYDAQSWLDLQSVTQYDAENILRRMGFYYPEDYLKKAKKLFKNKVGRSIKKAFFTAVQVDLDKTEDKENVFLRSAKEQTNLFLKAGIDTVEDTAKTNKKAVINDREPEQIIFLTRDSFDVVEIFRLSGEGDRVRPTRNIDASKRKLAALIASYLDDKVVSTDTYDKFWTSKGRRIEVSFERPQSYYEGKKLGEKRHRESKLHTEHDTEIKVYTEKGLIRIQGQAKFKELAESAAEVFNYRTDLDPSWEPETRAGYAEKVSQQEAAAKKAYREAENAKKIQEVLEWDLPTLKQLSKEQNYPVDFSYWEEEQDRLLKISRILTYLKRILSKAFYDANQTVSSVFIGDIDISLDEVYRVFDTVDRQHYDEMTGLLIQALEEAQDKGNSEAFWAFHLSRLLRNS